jgi:cystathionine beta-synthase
MGSVLDLIGETPLIEVTKFDRGPCRLFLKLESANPSGSIKDRPARFMIEAAEADGRLKPGAPSCSQRTAWWGWEDSNF